MLIKHHNISVKELNEYIDDNIWGETYQNSQNKKWNILSKLGNKYVIKYNLIPSHTLFPQHARNAFYKELKQAIENE